MPVIVSFMTPSDMGLGSKNVLGVGVVRASETVAVPGTSTITARDGEVALICSTETGYVLAAFGSTPDASATAIDENTTAAFGVPPGVQVPVAVLTGDLMAFEAV